MPGRLSFGQRMFFLDETCTIHTKAMTEELGKLEDTFDVPPPPDWIQPAETPPAKQP
jgi:hypothetical protein